MSEQPTSQPNQSGFSRAIPWFLSCYLIANFLWRLLTPAHEYPPRSIQIFEMAFDALMIVGMFGVRTKLPVWLFWLAIIAGVGLFAIRMTSDASWWTGHYMYWLTPR